MESAIWPRLGAVAERFWSPASRRDTADMYRRLDLFSVELDSQGMMHRKLSEHILQNIAQNNSGVDDATTLHVLIDTMKPVSFGRRSRTPITQQTPLVGVVDGTPPDSAQGRKIVALLEGGASNRGDLKKLFDSWAGLPPLFGEVQAPATELREMGRIGNEALSGRGVRTAKWLADSNTILDRAAKVPGLLEFTIIPAMRGLVAAANAGKL